MVMVIEDEAGVTIKSLPLGEHTTQVLELSLQLLPPIPTDALARAAWEIKSNPPPPAAATTR